MSERKHSTTVEDEIAQLNVGRPHVVILGAGASLASFPKGDRSGTKLPLMNNLASVVGLEPILEKYNVKDEGKGFESLYSDLITANAPKELIQEIDDTVYEYFESLRLPPEPTIYDHLLLCLREKDVVATFNWDPFLIQAMVRNRDYAPMPELRFLHGNVALGHCEPHNVIGSPRTECPKCSQLLPPTKLLYPVKKKDYNSDPFIKTEWKTIQHRINNAFILTVFGYSAPKTDVEAVSLMKEAWTTHKSRQFLETEIIDIKNKDELEKNWGPFLFSHHYRIENDFYSSWIANHPRRSCEAMWNQTMEAMFIDKNPIPKDLSFPQLREWLKPLLAVERNPPPRAGT